MVDSNITDIKNIEKFNQSHFSKEASGFTQLSNSVIQNIKCSFAYHVWSYLQSKPDNWTPNRQELINHFEVTDQRKMSNALTFLKESNLLETWQERGKGGSFGNYHIRVLNGSRFVQIEPKKRIRRKPDLKLVKPDVPNTDPSKSPGVPFATPGQNDKSYPQSPGVPITAPRSNHQHINKDQYITNKETVNSTVTVPSSLKDEKVKAIQQLLKTKLNDKYVSYKQAEEIIKHHKTDTDINWSLDNFVYHLSTEAGSNIKKKYHTFLYHVETTGYFEDKKTRTEEKQPTGLRNRKSSISTDMASSEIGSIIRPLNDKNALEAMSEEIKGIEKTTVEPERKEARPKQMKFKREDTQQKVRLKKLGSSEARKTLEFLKGKS